MFNLNDLFYGVWFDSRKLEDVSDFLAKYQNDSEIRLELEIQGSLVYIV